MPHFVVHLCFNYMSYFTADAADFTADAGDFAAYVSLRLFTDTDC